MNIDSDRCYKCNHIFDPRETMFATAMACETNTSVTQYARICRSCAGHECGPIYPIKDKDGRRCGGIIEPSGKAVEPLLHSEIGLVAGGLCKTTPTAPEEFYSQMLAEPYKEPKSEFEKFLLDHARFSGETFGPGLRTQAILDHIRKEISEVACDPTDLEEWIDLITLSLDGARRCVEECSHGSDQASFDIILAQLKSKLAKNKRRRWPPWSERDPNLAIEHIRDYDI